MVAASCPPRCEPVVARGRAKGFCLSRRCVHSTQRAGPVLIVLLRYHSLFALPAQVAARSSSPADESGCCAQAMRGSYLVLGCGVHPKPAHSSRVKCVVHWLAFKVRTCGQGRAHNECALSCARTCLAGYLPPPPGWLLSCRGPWLKWLNMARHSGGLGGPGSRGPRGLGVGAWAKVCLHPPSSLPVHCQGIFMEALCTVSMATAGRQGAHLSVVGSRRRLSMTHACA